MLLKTNCSPVTAFEVEERHEAAELVVGQKSDATVSEKATCRRNEKRVETVDINVDLTA